MNEVTIKRRVGVRELKSQLSRYLAHVAPGGSVVVTDHGRPVAELVPLRRRDRLAELVAAGRAASPTGSGDYVPEPLEGAARPVSDLVTEQRR